MLAAVGKRKTSGNLILVCRSDQCSEVQTAARGTERKEWRKQHAFYIVQETLKQNNAFGQGFRVSSVFVESTAFK
jgi:hypothetical protein